MQSRWNPTPPRGKLGLGPSTSQPRPSRQAYVFGPCFALTPFQRIPPDRYSRKNVPICPTRTVGESAFPFVPTESYRRVVLHAVFMLELSCTPKGSQHCQKELPPSKTVFGACLATFCSPEAHPEFSRPKERVM